MTADGTRSPGAVPGIKAFVGARAARRRVEISPERVAAFRAAVGAGSDGGSAEAPPTFLTIFRDGEFELLQRMGIPLSRVLHGEQEYGYDDPVRAGATLAYESVLANAMEKKGSSGTLQFLTFETVFEDESRAPGRRLGVARTVLLVRYPAESQDGSGA